MRDAIRATRSGSVTQAACRGVAILTLWTAVPGDMAARETDRLVVVMVFDGLAAATVDAHAVPNQERMRRDGAWSRTLLPVAPSVSLPNGVSLSTGCLPRSHGIVGNRFLDPARGLYDHDHDAGWLLACTHLQEVALRQGTPTELLGWYGATRDGVPTAEAIDAEDGDDPCDLATERRRGQALLEAIGNRPAAQGGLLLAYFCQPDHAQHFDGMDSTATATAVAWVDDLIGRARSALEARGGPVNLVIATDHGMTPVTTLINITRILRKADVAGRAVSNDGMAHVYLDEPAAAAVAQRALRRWDLFETHLRSELAEPLALGSSARVGDLVLTTRPPYFFADVDLWPWYTRFLAWIGPETAEVGDRLRADHGFDPRLPAMRGVLYLWGDGVRAGHELQEPRAIDLHPTVAALLGIAPGAPLDGRVLTEALATPQPAPEGAR